MIEELRLIFLVQLVYGAALFFSVSYLAKDGRVIDWRDRDHAKETGRKKIGLRLKCLVILTFTLSLLAMALTHPEGVVPVESRLFGVRTIFASTETTSHVMWLNLALVAWMIRDTGGSGGSIFRSPLTFLPTVNMFITGDIIGTLRFGAVAFAVLIVCSWGRVVGQWNTFVDPSRWRRASACMNIVFLLLSLFVAASNHKAEVRKWLQGPDAASSEPASQMPGT